MQAIYLSDGQVEIKHDYPRPRPAPDEALIRVTLAGICSTDLELIKGYAGGFRGILGHEFVGVVEETAAKEWIGRRVTGTINLGCGRCAVCLANGSEHCPNRTVLGIHRKDGAFADYLTLPLFNLVAIPDAVSDEQAVFTEPLAAALRIREQVQIRPTGRTAVVGPGRLGMLIGQVLSLDGTEVTMFGRSETSLQLPHAWGLPASLVSAGKDNSFDVVVEATGSAAGLAESLRLVRPLGTLILKSTFAGRAEVDLTKIVVAEINVQGSRCGPFSPAVRLLARSAVAVTDLIEGRYPLSEAREAFSHARQPAVRKVLLVP